MEHLLAQAGKSFLRAFAASLLILLPGVLAAPNLGGAYGVGVAALIASVVAGFQALQVFVPQLSFSTLIKSPYATWIDSFVRAFLGTFIVLISGLDTSPDLHTLKAVIIAALVGAVAAGIRALQGALTKGDVPTPTKGLDVPSNQARA